MIPTHAATDDAVTTREPVHRLRGAAVPVAIALGCLAVLLVACRHGLPGSPVSDDFLILAHQRFGRFDWLDAHGLAWYWRPASRQLYYLLLGPALLNAPWAAALVHALLLGVTFGGLWIFARRFLPAHGALVAASFPLLVEPARTLLAWPSAAQHLIAMAGVAAAVAAASRGRLAPALVSAGIAMTSIESAALVLPVLPLLQARRRARWIAGVAALGAVWFALRMLAATHGSAVPSSVAAANAIRIPVALALSFFAQLGLEDMPRNLTLGALLAYAGILAACVWGARRRSEPAVESRAEVAPAHGWLAVGGLLWWIAGSAPLAGVPDWNAWRSSLPGLGLGLAAAVAVARARPWAGASLVGLRVVLLLLAVPAATGVTGEPPPSTSQLSYPRLVRMQRVLCATRTVLSAPPGVARGAHVRYWSFPQLTEVGFGGSSALRVWFDDPTLVWEPFGETAGFDDTSAVVIAYDETSPGLAVRLRPEAQRELYAANRAVIAGDLAGGDRHLARALAAQREPARRLTAVVLGNRAALQLRLGALARADSLHRRGEGLVPQPAWERTEIAIALALADTARARAGLRAALALTPRDRGLRGLAQALAAAE